MKLSDIFTTLPSKIAGGVGLKRKQPRAAPVPNANRQAKAEAKRIRKNAKRTLNRGQ